MNRPALLLVATALAACKGPADTKAKAEGTAAPASSGGAASSASSSSGAAVVAGDPFEVAHDLDFTGAVSVLRGGVVVCQAGCSYPGGKEQAPRAVLVRGRGKPEPNLFPLAPFAAAQAYVVKRRGAVTFFGTPDALSARLSLSWLEADNDRSNWNAGPNIPTLVHREGAAWAANAGAEKESQARWLSHQDKLQLLAAHLPARAAFVGGGGPLLWGNGVRLELVAGGERKDVPGVQWDRDASGLRLADGRTVVVSSKSAWLLDKAGAPTKLAIQGATQVAEIGGAAWIVAEEGGHTKLLAPRDEKAFAVLGGAAPAPGPAAKIGFPKKRVDGCATPWVTLATPPQRNWDYATTRDAIKGKAKGLQADVTFVEYVEGTSVVFGAQCKTAKACDDLATLFEQETKGKSFAGCLDALGAIPNPDQPPENARVVYVDLESGDLL